MDRSQTTFLVAVAVVVFSLFLLAGKVKEQWREMEAETQKKRYEFMEDCLKDKKPYECKYMANKIYWDTP